MDRTDSILGADDLVTSTVRGLFPRVTARDARTQGLVDELDRWNTAMAAVPLDMLLTGDGLGPLLRSVAALRLAYAKAIKGTVWMRQETDAIHYDAEGGGLLLLTPKADRIRLEFSDQQRESLGREFTDIQPPHHDPSFLEAELASWLMWLELTDVGDAASRCRATMVRRARDTFPEPAQTRLNDEVWTVDVFRAIGGGAPDGVSLVISTDCCRLLMAGCDRYAGMAAPFAVVKELQAAVRMASIVTGRPACLWVGQTFPRGPLRIQVERVGRRAAGLDVPEAMRRICAAQNDPFVTEWCRRYSPAGFLPEVEGWCRELD